MSMPAHIPPPPPAGAPVIDYSAFQMPVSRAEVDAWRAAAKASGARWAQVNVGVIIVLVVLVPLLLLMLVIPLGAVAATLSHASHGATWAAIIVVPLVVVAALAGAVPLIIRFGGRGSRWERWLRLDRFARANGMVFSPADPAPRYAGSIFNIGNGRTANEHLVSQSGRFFDMGNYSYTTSNGKQTTTHSWGFMAFKLDRRLPHMVLDATANNGFFGSNLPASFDRSQVLSLEGDFDRYFTLYCPRQYERDALYVFTPDLMALLIDNAAPFDVEVIDDWMFVYASQPFAMTWPGVYERLFRILATVGRKTLSQTDRYADDRTGLPFVANVVAPPGTRLRRRFPLAAIIIVAVVLVLPVIVILGGLIGVALGTS